MDSELTRDLRDTINVDSTSFARVAALGVLSCCALQLLLIDRLADCFLVLVLGSATLLQIYVCGSSVFAQRNPVELIISWGHCVAMCLGPLIFKTLELEAVDEDLQSPVATIVFAGVSQTCVTAAAGVSHMITKYSSGESDASHRYFKLAYRSEDLWLLTAIGASALLMRGTGEGATIFDKIFHGLSVLVYCPVVLVYRRLSESSDASQWAAVRGEPVIWLFYVASILTAASIKNSRGLFMALVLSLAIVMFLVIMQRGARLARGDALIFTLALSSLVPLYFAAERLSESMLLARSERADISSLQLAQATVGYLFDDRAHASLKVARQTAFMQGEYSEAYLDSSLLSRLIMLKFVDNSLALQAVQSGYYSAVLRDTAWMKFLALFPGPALDYAGIYLDKTALEFSTGDLMNNLEYGKPLGSRIVGSALPHGVSMFGTPTAIALFTPYYVAIFLLINFAFTSRHRQRNMSAPLVLSLPSLFYFAVGDSYFDPITIVFRNIAQTAILFVALVWVIGVVRRSHA